MEVERGASESPHGGLGPRHPPQTKVLYSYMLRKLIPVRGKSGTRMCSKIILAENAILLMACQYTRAAMPSCEEKIAILFNTYYMRRREQQQPTQDGSRCAQNMFNAIKYAVDGCSLVIY